jgi:drug/metabolite transporter (DMT)-like permease
MVVVVALAAALCFAAASVFQHRVAQEAPPEHAMRLRLLTHLARRPAWLAGIGLDLGGFGLQWLALGLGSLVLVQPLLLAELLFALPLGAWAAHRAPHPRELAAAGAVAAGIAVALLASRPSSSDATASGATAVLLMAVVAAVTMVLVVGASGRSPSVRALLLGSAAGITEALLAVLMRLTAVSIDHGIGHAVLTWDPYALAAVGLVNTLMLQTAFQAGPLRASLPGLLLLSPLASVAVGLAVLHEHVHTTAPALALATVGLVSAAVGTVILTRFETVAAAFAPEVSAALELEPDRGQR